MLLLVCSYAWVWIPASLAASSNSSFTQHSSKSPSYFQVIPSWDRRGRKNEGNLNETRAFSAAQSTVATTLKSSRERWQRESTRNLSITPFISTAARRGRSRRRGKSNTLASAASADAVSSFSSWKISVILKGSECRCVRPNCASCLLLFYSCVS